MANKNAYNILIGADITNFKNQLNKEISEVVSKIAKDYPVKIKLDVEGLEKANKDISDLVNKLKSLGSDVDFSKVKKESKEAGDIAKKSQEKAKKSYQDTKRESDEYIKSLNSEISLLKEIEVVRRSSKGKVTKENTKVAGDEYRKMTVKEGDSGSTVKTEINHEKIKNDHLKAREGILTAIQGIESKIFDLKSRGLQEESNYNQVLKEIDSIRDGGTKDIKEQISGVESLKSQYETILNLEKEIGIERDRQSKINKLKNNADTKIFEDVLSNEDINKVYQKINEVSTSMGGTTVEFDEKLKEAENTLNRIVANQPRIEFLKGQEGKLEEAKDYVESLNVSEEERASLLKEVEQVQNNINKQKQQEGKISSLSKNDIKSQISSIMGVNQSLKSREKVLNDIKSIEQSIIEMGKRGILNESSYKNLLKEIESIRGNGLSNIKGQIESVQRLKDDYENIKSLEQEISIEKERQSKIDKLRADANKKMMDDVIKDEDVNKVNKAINEASTSMYGTTSDFEGKLNDAKSTLDKIISSQPRIEFLKGQEGKLEEAKDYVNSLNISEEEKVKILKEAESVQERINSLKEKEGKISSLNKNDIKSQVSSVSNSGKSAEDSVNKSLKAREDILRDVNNVENSIQKMKKNGLLNESSYIDALKEIERLRNKGMSDIDSQVVSVDRLKGYYQDIKELEEAIGTERERQSKIDNLKKRAETKISSDGISEGGKQRIDEKINIAEASLSSSTAEFENNLKNAENTINDIIQKQPKVEFLKGQEEKLKEAKDYVDSLNMSEKERVEVYRRLDLAQEKINKSKNDSRKISTLEKSDIKDQISMAIKLGNTYESNVNKSLKQREKILKDVNSVEESILQVKSKGLVEEDYYSSILSKINNIRKKGIDDIDGQVDSVKKLTEEYNTLKILESEISSSRGREIKIQNLEGKFDNNILRDVVSDEDIQNIQNKIDILKSSLSDTDIDFDDKLRDAEKTLNRISSQQTDIQFLEGQDQKLAEAKQYLDSLNMSQEEYLYASKEVERAEQLINNYRQSGAKLSKLQKDELKNQIAVAKNVGQVHEDTLKERKKQQLDLERLIDRFDTKSIRASRAFNSLDARDEFRKARVEIEKINEELERLTTLSGRDFDDGLNNVKKEIAQFDKMVLAGRNDVTDRHNSMFGRLGEAMRKIPVWMSAMTLFYAGVRQVKQGFQSVLDIDSSMTNLRKVTNGTTTELKEFEKTATDIGNSLGVLTKEAIDSATEFQRLGYTLQESTALSKNAILYSNVGDMNIDDATTSIISTIKGFGIEVDSTGQSVRKVVDVFNEVSNNFAISQQGIGEALQRSASTLYQAGNTLEQSVALVTSANASVQDPQKVGNALKTVAMRIRGVDEEGEEIKELIPELESMFNSFGETIMLDEDTFKSTFDIMKALKENWEDLSDIEQANITETLGGKRQGAIVSAMIQNWDDAEKSYEAGLNSAGSATREMEQYMESIEYKMNQLRVASETFWNTLLDKDAIKVGIELLTDLVNVMTKIVDVFSSTATITAGATIFSVMGSKQLRESVFNVKAMKEELSSIPAKNLATTTVQTNLLGKEMAITAKTTKSASMSLEGFAVAKKHVMSGILKMTVWTAIISTATQLVIKLLNREKEARERNINRLEDEITAYERLQTAKESVNFDEFMSLHSKNIEELDTSQYEKYIGLRDDVIDAMPEMIAYYDSEREAVLKTAEAIREMNKEKDEEYQKNKRKLFEEELEGNDYSELERSVGAGAGLVRDSGINQSRIDSFKFAEDFLKEQIAGMNLPIEEMDKKAIELRKEFQRRLEESNLGAGEISSIMMEFDMNVDSALIQGDVDSAKSFLNRAIDSLEETNDEINKKINDNKEDIKSNMESFTADVNEMFGFILKDMDVEVDSNEFVFLTTFKDEIVNNLEDFANGDLAGFIRNDLPALMSEAFSSLESYSVDLDSLMNMTGTSEEVENTFNTLIDKVNDGSVDGGRLASVLRLIRDSLVQVAQKNKEVASSFNWARDVTPILTGFVDEISGLDSAYRDLADGQELSLSQTFDLIDAHPELINQMEIENGTIKITGKSIRELASIKEKAFKADLESKRQEAKNAKAMAEADIRAILTRVNAYGVLIDAKQKVANLDAKEIERKGQEQLRQGNYWGYSQAMHAKHEVGGLIKTYQDLSSEEARLTKLLNFDFTSNLGSITGGSSSKSGGGGSKSGKSDATKELQDAIYVTDKYANKIDNLNKKIAEQNAIQGRYSENSKQYQNSIKEEIKLTKEKEKAINNEIKSLEKQIRNKNIEKTGLIRIGDDSDNKTARAKRAEIQQEIDEAKKRLNSLYSDSYSIASQIESLNMELVSAISAGFNKQRDTLDNEINYIEYSMGLYNESSKAYARLVNQKIAKSKEAEKTYRDEIKALENQLKNNKNLTQSQREEIVKMLNATEKSLLSANEETRKTINLLHELEMNKTFEKIAREAEAYSKAITKVRDKMQYDIDEDDYKGNINALKEIMTYNKGQAEDIKENIEQLKRQRKEFEGNHEAQKKINEEIRAQEDELYNANMAIKDNQKELEDYYSKIADTYVEIYKEQLESQRRAEEDKYEKTMKLEDKAHRKRMKHLDEQMDAISKIYDKQINELDKEDAERTFNMDLQGLQEEERKIRERINILSLDDSYRARAEREELEEQLADKLSEIEELKYRRELTLRKENLEELKKEELEKVESKREGYEEDYENFVNQQEEQREEREKHWEDMLNDEEKFSLMREGIMNGHFSNMLKDLETWDKDVSSRMEGLGNSVERNLTSKIREAIDELTGLRDMSIPDYDSIQGKDLAGQKDYVSEKAESNSITSEPSKSQGFNTNKSSSSSSSSSSKSASAPKVQKGKTTGDLYMRTGVGTHNKIITVMKKGSEMEIIGQKDGWYNVKHGGKTGWASSKYIAKLNKGGITPKFSGGKIAMLHEQEMIANKVQTKDILKTAKIVDGIKDVLPKGGAQSDIMKSISSKLNSIDYIKLQNAIKNAVGGGSEPQVVNYNYDLDVNVDNFSGDKKELDAVSRQLMTKLKREKGGRM